MTHLADGTLRRILDEPRAISDAERAHLDSCAACRARADTVARDARAAAELLAVPPARPDAALALARLGPISTARTRLVAFPRAPRWLAVTAAALVIAFTLTTTGLADSFIRIFEPRQFVPVTISQSDLRGVPDLAAYGTMTWSGPGAAQWRDGGAGAFVTGDAAAARAKSGLPLLLPATLPTNVDRSTVQFRVVDAARMTFTFDAAKASAAAAHVGATPPPMPPSIAGASLAVDLGPAAMQLYKVSGAQGDLPGLVIVEGRPPVVSSSGPSLREVQDYLLAQPGISPSLAAQVRALGDPSTMVPVPVPLDLAVARPVTVRGQPGLLLGDSTAIFSVVFWREGNVVRAVGGPLSDAQVLGIAADLR